jgi:hypothetical protein
MQERGATPRVVEDAIATAPRKSGDNNCFIYENSQIKVITNPNGDVVSVIVK